MQGTLILLTLTGYCFALSCYNCRGPEGKTCLNLDRIEATCGAGYFCGISVFNEGRVKVVDQKCVSEDHCQKLANVGNLVSCRVCNENLCNKNSSESVKSSLVLISIILALNYMLIYIFN